MSKRFAWIITLLLGLIGVVCFSTIKGTNIKKTSFKKHTFSPGLVMAGYQGWFDAAGDSSGRGWYHYQRAGRFEPGYCEIDFWPDMTEYKKRYPTAFSLANGTPAAVYSPEDESSVKLHFKWMQQYGIDGVFMQRFVKEVQSESGHRHFNTVLHYASKAALDYDRTIAIMYDLSGMSSEDTSVVFSDWKNLLKQYGYNQRARYSNYLFNDGKPLVAIWGVGFNDHRKYNLDDVARLIKFFKSKEGGNCSVLLGVPTYWREQGSDCIKGTGLHKVIEMADIVHPWFVGRFNEQGYDNFKLLIGKDIAWCNAHHLKYMPVIFPGFSWHNMNNRSPQDQIPRNRGNFFWKQFSGAIQAGASTVYIAMFDEMNEGTAIFKVSKNPPVGKSPFVTFEDGIPEDYYLYLAGYGAKVLKKQLPMPPSIPLPLKGK